MNKKKAFEIAKRTFPALTPARPSGFTGEDGVLLVPCFEQPVCLTVYTETDLHRLRGMIDMLLAQKE